MSDLSKIEESFKAVYQPLAQAIGLCLAGIKHYPINATAVVSAIMAVAIDIAAKANALSKEHEEKDLIDSDHVARFMAFTMTDTLKNLSPEMKQALNNVALAGIKPAEKAN